METTSLLFKAVMSKTLEIPLDILILMVVMFNNVPSVFAYCQGCQKICFRYKSKSLRLFNSLSEQQPIQLFEAQCSGLSLHAVVVLHPSRTLFSKHLFISQGYCWRSVSVQVLNVAGNRLAFPMGRPTKNSR